jgi:hypothetical protein
MGFDPSRSRRLSAGQRDGGKLDAQAETRRGEWAGVSHRAEAEAQLSHDRQQLHSASPYLAREDFSPSRDW